MNQSLFKVIWLVGILFAVEVLAADQDLSVTLLTQYPDPAKAGDTMELRINIRNNGDAYINNILVEFVPDFPFSLVPGETARKEIETLPNWPDEANFKTLLYRLLVNRDAIDGQHKVKIRYSTSGVSWIEESFNIDITSKEFAEIIYIDKSKLIPGKETEMVFTINNIGNAPLQNLIFSWSEPDDIILPVNTDNTRYIKYLAPGESIPLKYTVIASVNAEPDLYELNLNLEYDIKNASGAKKEIVTTQAGVFVGGETDFDVAFSESSNGETSFSISNIGSVPAYSVSVIIPKQNGWRVSGSNSVIIGNLNKGDYTIASFKLQSAIQRTANETKSGFFQDSQTVKVQVVYTDTTGKRNTVEKEVPLNPQSIVSGTDTTTFVGRRTTQQQGFFSKYKWYMIAGVILFIAVISYMRYRKRENKGIREEKSNLFSWIKGNFRKKQK